MSREGRGEPESIFPRDFGVPFAPSDMQRQAGMAGEQLSALAESQYPPQAVEITKFTNVPIWRGDARISAGRRRAEIGNALVRIAATRLRSNGPKIAKPASKYEGVDGICGTEVRKIRPRK